MKQMVEIWVNGRRCILYVNGDVNEFCSVLKLSREITVDDIPEIERLFDLEYEKMYGK